MKKLKHTRKNRGDNPPADLLKLARRVVFIERPKRLKEEAKQLKQRKSIRAHQKKADKEFNERAASRLGTLKPRLIPVIGEKDAPQHD